MISPFLSNKTSSLSKSSISQLSGVVIFVIAIVVGSDIVSGDNEGGVFTVVEGVEIVILGLLGDRGVFTAVAEAEVVNLGLLGDRGDCIAPTEVVTLGLLGDRGDCTCGVIDVNDEAIDLSLGSIVMDIFQNSLSS